MAIRKVFLGVKDLDSFKAERQVMSKVVRLDLRSVSTWGLPACGKCYWIKKDKLNQGNGSSI